MRGGNPGGAVGRPLATVLLVIVSAAPAALCQGNASIAGTITGDDGKPIAAMVVAKGATTSSANFRAQAAANGAFTISNLPAGTYTLCAAVEPLGYVDPCDWSLRPPGVQLAAGQAASGVSLVAKKGGVLQVRLNDPDKILGQTPAPNQAAPGVLLGVFTPRRLFRSLQLAGTDATGRSQQLTIPLDDTPLTLYITGHAVQIFAPSGGQVGPNGKQVSIPPRNGSAPSIMTFTVWDPNKHGQ